MTATKLKLAISALVVAGTATAFVLQHQAQEKLRVDNAALTQQLAQLRADNEDLFKRQAITNSSQMLSTDQSGELLKLRGEVGVLQRQASESSQKAQAAEQKLATFLSVQAKFTRSENVTINAEKYLSLDLLLYAGDHDNHFPTNDILYQLVKDYDGNKNLLQDIPAIEFINGELVNFLAKNKLEHPDMVVLRERIARQAPDGTWHRIYGLADGSVQTATSYDGNFDAWEKANTFTPPSNQ